MESPSPGQTVVLMDYNRRSTWTWKVRMVSSTAVFRLGYDRHWYLWKRGVTFQASKCLVLKVLWWRIRVLMFQTRDLLACRSMGPLGTFRLGLNLRHSSTPLRKSSWM